MNNSLKELSVEHPYYCSGSNYFSNECGYKWETMTDFIEEWGDADIDMNLIFRWDIYPRGENGETGRYYAEVFIIQQRKGIFSPHYISHVNEKEAELFKELALKHWNRLLEMWSPISNK